MIVMKRYLYFAFCAVALCLSSCSGVEGDYDDVLKGVDDVCEDLDYVLDDVYSEIVNDYVGDISKHEKGADADFMEFIDQLTITYPYNYAASGFVSGLFGDFGDALIAVGDEAIRSKSKSEIVKKIKSNMNIGTLLVYISLVQKEGSVVYCFETSGFDDKEIELTTKDLKSILADFDYNQLVDGGGSSSQSSPTHYAESSGSGKADGGFDYETADAQGVAADEVCLTGKIGGKYPVEMMLDMSDWDNVNGRYRYTSSGSGAWLSLRGSLSEGSISMKEYNEKGECCGTWEGECWRPDGKFIFTGSMTTSAGKSFSVELSQ